MAEQVTERLGEYMFADPEYFTGKTWVWTIRSRRGGMLGTVKWYGPWRQYTLWPNRSTLFNADCLIHVSAFLQRKNAEHKRGRDG